MTNKWILSAVTCALLMSSVAAAGQIQTDQIMDTQQRTIDLNRLKVKKLFQSKSYYYVDLHNRQHPIIGIAQFDSNVSSMDYRQIIGGKDKGHVELELRKEGFVVEWRNPRYVKIKAVRKNVIVTDTPKLLRFYNTKKAAQMFLTRKGYDVFPPVIELEGSREMTIEQYHRFLDPGAKAIDKRDGEVRIRVVGHVDGDRLGTYRLKYIAKDSHGNVAIKNRLIKVVPTNDTLWHVSSVKELREALEGASSNDSNDVIFVAKGEYGIEDDGLGSFTYRDNQEQNLTIRADLGLRHNEVILDGNNSDSVLVLNNDNAFTVTIDGISVVNGNSTRQGGGIVSNGSLYLFDTLIAHNRSSEYGGGVSVDADASLISVNSTFDHNSARKGGGGFYIRVGSAPSRWLYLYKTTLIGNESSMGNGGGFYAINNDNNGDAVIERCFVTQNYAKEGGGFKYYSLGTSINITDTKITKNTAQYIGGFSSRIAKVMQSRILDNEASIGGGGGFATNDVLIDASYIVGNRSKTDGAAFYSYHAGMSNSYIARNSAEGNKANVYVSYGYFANNDFMDNDNGLFFRHNGVLINNVFDNPSADWEIVTKEKGVLLNNYIDDGKIDAEGDPLIKQNNLLPSEVGGLNFKHGMYPTVSSPTIDKGLAEESQQFIDSISDDYYQHFFESTLKKDLKGRVRDAKRDVGAVEYRH